MEGERTNSLSSGSLNFSLPEAGGRLPRTKKVKIRVGSQTEKCAYNQRPGLTLHNYSSASFLVAAVILARFETTALGLYRERIGVSTT